MPSLRFTDDAGVRRERPLEAVDPVVTIGRTPGNTITTAHKSVARRHAQLLRNGTAWEITDFQSPNGTRVNGSPVTRARLVHGDVIHCGNFELVFLDPTAIR